MEDRFQKEIAAISRIPVVSAILDVVCGMTGMGVAAVARLIEGRWIACEVLDKIGFGLLPGGELKIEAAICPELRRNREALIIRDLMDDGVYRDHPALTTYGFRSYISVPIILADGAYFGTLCAIDPGPLELNAPEIVKTFKLFAELIAFHVDAGQRVDPLEARIPDESKTAELREQFVALLGHDLRNPLASISAGTNLLLRMPLDEKAVHIVDLMQASVTRMTQLVENVLDFARNQLGGELEIYRGAQSPLEAVLQGVVVEAHAVWPDRGIETSFEITEPVDCDSVRIGQLLANLLDNALNHGASGTPVRVLAKTGNGRFELSVEGGGIQIPNGAIERRFAPFAGGDLQPEGPGLGLMLHIASEIARAHGGEINVVSVNRVTRFIFRMVLR